MGHLTKSSEFTERSSLIWKKGCQLIGFKRHSFVFITVYNMRRFRWPRRLRRGSAAACFVGLRVRIPAAACMSLVTVVCCQVEVSATSQSLVQSSPAECVCVCVYVCLWLCVSLSTIRCNNNPLHLQWLHRKQSDWGITIKKDYILLSKWECECVSDWVGREWSNEGFSA
jgi:hypothetical protein